MADAWSTVITRESEWDDTTRDLALALRRYDDECCPGCGLHKSVLADPEHNHFTFDERVCDVCRAQDVYGRVVRERDDQAMYAHGEHPPARTPQPADGRQIMLRPMTPEEVDAVRAKTRPNGR